MSERLTLLKGRIASLNTLSNETSGKRGITPGGIHQDSDGAEWYVKHHDNEDHAHTEHLVNQIYRHLDKDSAPHTQILYKHNQFTGTKHPVYFSKMLPTGYKDLIHYGGWEGGEVHSSASKKFLNGHVIDTLVGVGDHHMGNVGLINGHTPVRVDNGSALQHNAFGEHRGGGLPPVGDNLYTGSTPAAIGHAYRHGHFGANPEGDPFEEQKKIRKHLGSPQFLRPHVKAILNLRNEHGGWRGFVEKVIPGAHENVKRESARILEERTHELAHAVAHGRNLND